MSLIFNPAPSIEVSFTLKSIPEKNGIDTVLVGNDAWTHLQLSRSDRAALSIRPLRTHRSAEQNQNTIRTISCWAVLDDNVEELAIPPEWSHTYGHIFSQTAGDKSLALTITQPIQLTEVIITALTRDAYDAASSQSSPLESWLADESRMLRQGAHITITPESPLSNGHGHLETRRNFRYRLDMAEPVPQGYFAKGSTRVYVTLPVELNEDTLPGDNTHLLGASDESGSEADGIEIDESFLAGSVLHSRQNTTPSSPPDTNAHLTDGRSHPNGLQKEVTSQKEPQLRAKPLTEPISTFQDDCTLYLRTSDLGKVGVLNGDWAIVNPSETSDYRLVRISARDDILHNPGTVMGSPVLLHNLLSHNLASSSLQISVHPSPFGSGQPTIPTARSVTLARVASPLSVDRTYQPLFLQSLKTYFDSIPRLVKQGDIIAIGLDTDSANFSGDADEGDQDAGEKSNLINPASSVRVNEVVFFVITNLEHDVPQSGRHAQPADMYVGSTIGELGCWVDPAVTRMVQTGVEHSRIPQAAVYLGADHCGPNTLLTKFSDHSRFLGARSAFSKLFALSSAAMARRAADYDLHLSILLKGARGVGKFTVASWVAQRLGMHLLEINCYDLIGETDAKTEGTLRARFEKCGSCSPCILILRHLDALSQTTQGLENGKESVIENVLRECLDDLRNGWTLTGYPTIIFGTATETGRVPTGLLSCFKHEVAFEAPDESERYEILDALLSKCALAPDVSLSTIATQTAALVASDLVDLVERAQLLSVDRALTSSTSNPHSDHYLVHSGILLTAADFEGALGKARASYSQSIGAPNIPSVSWDDVGGLAHVKSDILDTIQLPLDHPELFADGLKKRSGILLYGPPGTGKTLLAKAVATSCSLNFFSIKGPELLNMYIGESEANVRRVFQRARDAKPCVIFFDELDSVAPKRGNHGDSGGVMDRIVSQLLAELDGMSAGKGGADVFVIGATNRPDLLDPALLRPGRFDRMLYLGVSETHEAQHDILQALTRKFRLHQALDLRRVAEQCPFNYTGADFYALCSDAMLNAMSRKAEELEVKIGALNKEPSQNGHPYPLTPQYYLAEMATFEDTEVLVTHHDFDRAFHDLVPSVSQSEMDHYKHIQHRFSRKSVRAENESSDVQSNSESGNNMKSVKGKSRAVE